MFACLRKLTIVSIRCTQVTPNASRRLHFRLQLTFFCSPHPSEVMANVFAVTNGTTCVNISYFRF